MVDLGDALYAALDRAGRAAHQAFANSRGYFWLPCPLCRELFGGHEWRDIDGHSASIPTEDPRTDKGICPTCTQRGEGCRIRASAAGWPGVAVAVHECEHNRHLFRAADGQGARTWD